MTTPDLIAAFRRHLVKMTPGEWAANCWQPQHRHETHSNIHSKHGGEWLPIVTTHDIRGNRNVERQELGNEYDDVIYIDLIGQANTEGIAFLHNHAAALCDRAERAEAEAERLRGEIDLYEGMRDGFATRIADSEAECEQLRAELAELQAAVCNHKGIDLVFRKLGANNQKLEAELAASSKRVAVLMDRIDKAQAALPTDRDLTGTEAAIAYELAEPVPITNERIKAMCDYATGTMTSKGDGDKELIPSVEYGIGSARKSKPSWWRSTSDPHPGRARRPNQKGRCEVSDSGRISGDCRHRAKNAVRDIIADLSDRRGLKHEWNAIDNDVQKEIRKTWAAIIADNFRDLLKGSAK